MRIDGAKIRKVMAKRDLLLIDLARAASMAPAALSSILSGVEPIGERRLQRLRAGLRAVGITPDEVLVVAKGLGA